MKKEYLDKQVVRAMQRAQLVISSPIFQREVKRIRQKWGLPPGGVAGGEPALAWQRSAKNNPNQVRSDIRELLILMKKPASWAWDFERYILTNWMASPLGAHVSHTIGKDPVDDRLIIVIEPDTTKRDILELLPEVRSIQQNMWPNYTDDKRQKKFAEIPSLKLYQRLAELDRANMSPKMMAETIHEEFHEVLTEKEVKDKIRWFNQRI